MKKLLIKVVVILFIFCLILVLNNNKQLNVLSDEIVVDNDSLIDYIKQYKIIELDSIDKYHELKKEGERLLLEKEEQERINHEKYLLQREKEKQTVQVSRSSEVVETDSDWMTYEATYYTPKCYKCSGITASGYDVRQTIYYNNYRVIAVDPRVIPLWSLVEIVTPHETFKAVALDTGGVIKNNKIDILVNTKDEAFSKGRHSVKLRVIKYGNNQ